ncbi:MAG: hypothetical protein WCK02_03220 [Bacteroidota bacterium]
MKTKALNNNTRIYSLIIFIYFCFASQSYLVAQNYYIPSHEDSLALEEVIVEKYYISNPNDSLDKTLPVGSVTYRVFIKMKPGYKLQMVYGDSKHELSIKTSTYFYNDSICGAETAFQVDAKKIHIGNVALDSWITLAAANRIHVGIQKSEDTGGGFVANRESLFKNDGFANGTMPNFQVFNIDLKAFGFNNKDSIFSSNNSAWAALGGVQGSTDSNCVLIAQLTTNGYLSFELNIQIGTPTGGFVKFVAKNPSNSEIQFNGLKIN